jgi:hypothetical protein
MKVSDENGHFDMACAVRAACRLRQLAEVLRAGRYRAGYLARNRADGVKFDPSGGDLMP